MPGTGGAEDIIAPPPATPPATPPTPPTPRPGQPAPRAGSAPAGNAGEPAPPLLRAVFSGGLSVLLLLAAQGAWLKTYSDHWR